MALTKFHVVAFLVAANRQGVDDNYIKRAIPYVILPDAIRCLGLSRTITHFEIGNNGIANGIAFPTDIKSITSSSELIPLCETNGIYNQVAIGDTTSLEKFAAMNEKHLPSWAFNFIKLHLQQDICYDAYIREVIDCSHRYDAGNPFYFNSAAYDAKSVRVLITEIGEQEFRALCRIYERESGVKISQEWLDRIAAPAIKEAYSPIMAAGALSHMRIGNKAKSPARLVSEEQLERMRGMIEEIVEVSEAAIANIAETGSAVKSLL